MAVYHQYECACDIPTYLRSQVKSSASRRLRASRYERARRLVFLRPALSRCLLLRSRISMSMAFFSVCPPPQRPHGHLPLNQRHSGGLCAPVHGSHALERADHARRPQQAVLITGPCHRRTDKLALTISIGDSSAIRPASAAPRIVEDLAGSLCRPRREQSVPFHRLG